MKQPRIERVRSDYQPRYPQQLSPAEYRALIAPDQQRRLLAAAAAAGVAMAALPAQGPAGKAPAKADREAAVLAVLRALPREHDFWFQHTSFVQQKNDCGSDVVVPQIPISFGNSHNGVFDSERARQAARGLFLAYGLKVANDVDPGVDGVQARLDGLDAAAKVGFELRGRTPAQQGMFGGAEPEPEAQGLDAGEHRRLQASGFRVFTADVASFPLMDGDQFTPLIAWLAGVVGFLNSVTDGPDIDLGAVLGPRRLRLPLPVQDVAGSSLGADGARRLELQAPALVPLRVDPDRGAELGSRSGRYQFEWKAADGPVTTAGAPTLLQLSGIDSVGQLQPRLRLVQAGEPPLQLEAEGSRLLLPSRFDAGKPFTLTLQLAPGSWTLPGAVEIWLR